MPAPPSPSSAAARALSAARSPKTDTEETDPVPYSRDAWSEIAPLFERIVALPFNQELAAGTLRRDRFVHYLIQDAHYLAMFARACSRSRQSARCRGPGGPV